MKILIIGGSDTGSVGSLIRPLLLPNEVDCVSRHYSTVGKLFCDVTNPQDVDGLISKTNPEVVIFAVGKYILTNFEGNSSWKDISELVVSRVLGSMIVSEASIRYKVKKIIFFGGTLIGADSRMIHYKPINAALWNLVRCLNIHTKIDPFYLELGLVYPGRIGTDYIESLPFENRLKCLETTISPEDITRQIKLILSGVVPRGNKVTVNKGLI